MTTIVADTSALVSLGVAGNRPPDPLSICLEGYDVFLPEEVVTELNETASYDDEHGNAATLVLDRTDETSVRSVTLDTEFPLDDGENAAVALANEVDAAILLCDEFRHLGLIHASLANTRLVTTPTLLSVFVDAEKLTPEEATSILDAISQARSWDANSYVERARSLLGAK